jgi:hypothetical protein
MTTLDSVDSLKTLGRVARFMSSARPRPRPRSCAAVRYRKCLQEEAPAETDRPGRL